MGDANEKSAGGTRRVRVGEGWATLIELPGIRLAVVDAGAKGQKKDFSIGAIRIGTATDNDFVIEEKTVSRHHARLVREEAGWVITDLGSSNGTFVDAVRVREGFVKEGSRIQLGQCILELRSRVENHYAVVREESSLGPLVGTSAGMREVYALIRAIAPTTASVLIQGESGTGKELVARAIHEMSGRTGPLVVFDAAATSQELIRSELFGHSKGAFTGAAESREGAFRRAHGGTIFIDEFGELPMALQPNLLRVLENREVTPIGSDRPLAVDVRVVVATNRDLEAQLALGQFREDLYHRVAVVRILLPSLRDRCEDIPLLVRDFAAKFARDTEIGDDVIEAMGRHDWPGNVRALRNAVERLGIVCRGRRATPKDLDLTSSSRAAGPMATGKFTVTVPAPAAPVVRTLEETEREAIREALERAGGNKSAAARQLGIALTTLKRKLASPGSEPEDES